MESVLSVCWFVFTWKNCNGVGGKTYLAFHEIVQIYLWHIPYYVVNHITDDLIHKLRTRKWQN